MARSAAFTRSAQRIARLCDPAGDARALRLAILGEMRQAVGFDAYAWLLTDPQTSVGSAPLADVPCLPELPRLIRLKYLTGVNRWTTLRAAPVALLQDATGGQPSRSLLWRDLLADYDIGDVASLVFRDRFGCWGFLDLWRAGRPARFSPAEAAYLAGITGPVTTALRRSQAGTFTARDSRGARRVGVVMVAKLQIRVAWDECDPEGMVHGVAYFRWMDQAIHALMLEVGFGHRTIYERFGAYVPALDAAADRLRYLLRIVHSAACS